MAACPGCGADLSPDARFCAACGFDLSKPDAPTRAFSGSSVEPLRSAPPGDDRFVPGTILAGRYRVVALLGRGGMGQVYRADDLKLGQAVALKFLPDTLAQDDAALARFHGEVRVARQLSHPNLCRVFDISDVDGHHFLSMEYIDGEDLSSLIRRIGRLPVDKALEIARQLCAGLAAAHDAGVVHRDLKPANVMIDGRGRARLTDFGLAGLDTEAQAGGLVSGTPAYMSPEQFEGNETNARSDIYALGLVLYEMFTGRRAFDAPSLAQMQKQREHSSPTNPSHWVKDLDPVIERVILRCLEHDPSLRPASALQVSAALPGGDPLAAALAAGETPSPEMVAASPAQGTWSVARAAWCVVALVASLVALTFTEQVDLYRMVPLQKSPQVLADRAQALIESLGYTQPPRDRAHGFELDNAYFGYEADPLPAPERWQRLRTGQPATYYFWYRQSPVPLRPNPGDRNAGQVSPLDPPSSIEGMVSVSLDPRGRLLSFAAVPPAQLEPSLQTNSAAPDWSPLFQAAGLDPAQFVATAAQWTPPSYATVVSAWEGRFADHPDLPLRVEAAAIGTRVVLFQLIAPWDLPALRNPGQKVDSYTIGTALTGALVIVAIVGAIVMLRRNLAQGRGDRRGALRLAIVAFCLTFVSWMLGSDTTPDNTEAAAWLMMLLEGSLFRAGLLWVGYLALEPQIRRQQPRLIVSWIRLLNGELRDPLVGRDLLIGLLLGLGASAALKWSGWLKLWSDHPLAPNRFLDVDTLGDPSRVVSIVLAAPTFSVSLALLTLILLVVARRVVRRERLASLCLWGVGLTLIVLITARSWPFVVASAIALVLAIIAASSYGLVTGSAFWLVIALILPFPLVTDLSAWPAGASLMACSTVGALALYGYWATTSATRAHR
ncbi:MAG: serine/threonine-protein kinase [Acidobacteriota bacterium]